MKNTSARTLPKHEWIRNKVKGKTFVDVGGLWGTVNETVTIASKAGAKRTTMVDIQRKHSKWWQFFHERCKELGVNDYDSLVANVCASNFANRVGNYDVVHCSGIIYHVPDPVSVIQRLVSIANEYLIIGSMLVPDRIENDKGVLEIPPGVLYYVPTLEETERQILGQHFEQLGVKVKGLNAAPPIFISPTQTIRTGPWWCLFTAETMTRMCELFDLEVEDQSISRQGAQNLLCRINKKP